MIEQAECDPSQYAPTIGPGQTYHSTLDGSDHTAEECINWCGDNSTIRRDVNQASLGYDQCCNFDNGTCTMWDIKGYNVARPVDHPIAATTNPTSYASLCVWQTCSCATPSRSVSPPTVPANAKGSLAATMVDLGNETYTACLTKCELEYIGGVCVYTTASSACVLLLPVLNDGSLVASNDLLSKLRDGTASTAHACSVGRRGNPLPPNTACDSGNAFESRVKISTAYGSNVCPPYLPGTEVQLMSSPHMNCTLLQVRANECTVNLTNRHLRIFRARSHTFDCTDGRVCGHFTSNASLAQAGFDTTLSAQCASTSFICTPSPCRIFDMSFFNDRIAQFPFTDHVQLGVGTRNIRVDERHIDVVGYSQCDPQFGTRVFEYDGEVGKHKTVAEADRGVLQYMEHNEANRFGVGTPLWPDTVPFPPALNPNTPSLMPEYMFKTHKPWYEEHLLRPDTVGVPPADEWQCADGKNPPPVWYLKPLNGSEFDYELVANALDAKAAWKSAAGNHDGPIGADVFAYSYTPPRNNVLFDPQRVVCDGSVEARRSAAGAHVHSLDSCWDTGDNVGRGYFGGRPTSYANDFAVILGYPQQPANFSNPTGASQPGAFALHAQALGIVFPPSISAKFAADRTAQNYRHAKQTIADLNPYILFPTQPEFEKVNHDETTCHLFSPDSDDQGGCSWLPNPITPEFCPATLAMTLEDTIVPAHQSSNTAHGAEYGLFDFENPEMYRCTNLWHATINTYSSIGTAAQVRTHGELECQAARTSVDLGHYYNPKPNAYGGNNDTGTLAAGLRELVTNATAFNTMFRYKPIDDELQSSPLSIPFAIDAVLPNLATLDSSHGYSISTIRGESKQEAYNEPDKGDILQQLRCGAPTKGDTATRLLCTYSNTNTLTDLNHSETHYYTHQACPEYQCNIHNRSRRTVQSTRSDMLRRANSKNNASQPSLNATFLTAPPSPDGGFVGDGSMAVCTCCSHGDMWDTDPPINAGASIRAHYLPGGSVDAKRCPTVNDCTKSKAVDFNVNLAFDAATVNASSSAQDSMQKRSPGMATEGVNPCDGSVDANTFVRYYRRIVAPEDIDYNMSCAPPNKPCDAVACASWPLDVTHAFATKFSKALGDKALAQTCGGTTIVGMTVENPPKPDPNACTNGVSGCKSIVALSIECDPNPIFVYQHTGCECPEQVKNAKCEAECWPKDGYCSGKTAPGTKIPARHTHRPNAIVLTGGIISTDVFYPDTGEADYVADMPIVMAKREINQMADSSGLPKPYPSAPQGYLPSIQAYWHTKHLSCPGGAVEPNTLVATWAARSTTFTVHVKPVGANTSKMVPFEPNGNSLLDHVLYDFSKLSWFVPNSNAAAMKVLYTKMQTTDFATNLVKNTPIVHRFPVSLQVNGDAPARTRVWTSAMTRGAHCTTDGSGAPTHDCQLLTPKQASASQRDLFEAAYGGAPEYLQAKTNVARCGYRWPTTTDYGLRLGSTGKRVNVTMFNMYDNDIAARHNVDVLMKGFVNNATAYTSGVEKLALSSLSGRKGFYMSLPGACTRWPFGYAHKDAFDSNTFVEHAMASGAKFEKESGNNVLVFPSTVSLRYCELITSSDDGTRATASNYVYVANDPYTEARRRSECSKPLPGSRKPLLDSIVGGIVLKERGFEDMCTQPGSTLKVCIFSPGFAAVRTLTHLMNMPFDFTGYVIFVLDLSAAAFGQNFRRTDVHIGGNAGGSPDRAHNAIAEETFDMMASINDYVLHHANVTIDDINKTLFNYTEMRCPYRANKCFDQTTGMNDVTIPRVVFAPYMNATDVVVRHSDVTIAGPGNEPMRFGGLPTSGARTHVRVYVGATRFTLGPVLADQTECAHTDGMKCAVVVLTGNDASHATLESVEANSAHPTLMILGASTPFFQTAHKRVLVANSISVNLLNTGAPNVGFDIAIAGANGSIACGGNSRRILYEPYGDSNFDMCGNDVVVDVQNVLELFSRTQEERVYHRTVATQPAVVALLVLSSVALAIVASFHVLLYAKPVMVGRYLVKRIGVHMLPGQTGSDGDSAWSVKVDKQSGATMVHITGPDERVERASFVVAAVYAGVGGECKDFGPSLVRAVMSARLRAG